MRRIWLSLPLALSALASACATSPGPAESDMPAVSETSSNDMFILRVDVGRTAVFTDRIATVLAKLPDPPGAARGPTDAETEANMAAHERAWAARDIRAVTLDYLRLEGEACANGHFAAITCKSAPLPPWLADRADKPVSAAEITARLNWLQERMSPLLDVVCEQGKTLVPEDEGGGEMFCSVE